MRVSRPERVDARIRRILSRGGVQRSVVAEAVVSVEDRYYGLVRRVSVDCLDDVSKRITPRLVADDADPPVVAGCVERDLARVVFARVVDDEHLPVASRLRADAFDAASNPALGVSAWGDYEKRLSH